ncbi:hypothetical protein HBH72_048670 [Parastagonospora nodorum]|nr:hypothetical protein HBH72_048670 [Parastagonospora nodorum]
MELYRPRTASIPPNFRQIPAAQRFNVTDAAQLKLKLQALDDKLEPHVDASALENACLSRPFHEDVYVDGSEEFFLLVKNVARADLIPAVYIDAYTTVQQGRFPLNRPRVSDFKKGVDPTFSEIRALLPRIDELCGTRLSESFLALEDQVKPFPFLRLPAELALHVYSCLLPREDHIALLYQPTRDHKPPRARMDIMRTSRQMHKEVTKYFYENRTLFMIVARDKHSQMLSREYASRYYETLAAMSPETRALFTRLEVDIAHFSEQTFASRRFHHIPSVTDPMQHIFDLLPHLKTIVIVLGVTPARPAKAVERVITQRNETLRWLLEYVPPNVDILWERASLPKIDTGAAELQSMIEARGSFIDSESITMQLAAQRRKVI